MDDELEFQFEVDGIWYDVNLQAADYGNGWKNSTRAGHSEMFTIKGLLGYYDELDESEDCSPDCKWNNLWEDFEWESWNMLYVPEDEYASNSV